MKHKVALSTYNIFMALALPAVLIGLLIKFYNEGDIYMSSAVSLMIIALVCCSFFYAPVYEEGVLIVCRPLRSRRIFLEEIASMEKCAPAMGAKTVCGSGGFMGCWGRFYERDFGKYFAYHGNASDGFLVTLHDGRRYMLGCRNAAEMLEAVKASL